MLRFFLCSNEGHEASHIHVKAGGDEVKLLARPDRVATNHGFNGRELSEIERLVEQHRLGLLEAWNGYLG